MYQYFRILVLIGLSIGLSFIPLIGQSTPTVVEDTDIVIRNINGLLAKATPDIEEAINSKKLKDRVAITQVKIFDYTRSFQKKIKIYIAKNLEGIYADERYFRFIASTKSLNRTVVKRKEFKTTFDGDLFQMANFAKEINADAFAIVNFVIEGKVTKLVITVRDVEDNHVIWQGKWEQLNYNKFLFAELGLSIGANTTLEHLPLYLSLMMVKRTYGFFEWGIFFNAGAAFFAFNNGSIVEQLTVYNVSGMKVGLEIFDLAKVSYFGLELLITLKSGLALYYVIKSEGSVLRRLHISFLVAPGFTFLLNRDWSVNLEFDVIGFTAFVGSGYRF